MTPANTATVAEALRAARTELTALIHDDIHIPSGPLMEQLDDAIAICEENSNG